MERWQAQAAWGGSQFPTSKKKGNSAQRRWPHLVYLLLSCVLLCLQDSCVVTVIKEAPLCVMRVLLGDPQMVCAKEGGRSESLSNEGRDVTQSRNSNIVP